MGQMVLSQLDNLPGGHKFIRSDGDEIDSFPHSELISKPIKIVDCKLLIINEAARDVLRLWRITYTELSPVLSQSSILSSGAYVLNHSTLSDSEGSKRNLLISRALSSQSTVSSTASAGVI